MPGRVDLAALADLADLAELAERRHRDPSHALERAASIGSAAKDPEVESTAAWVAGLALHELGRVGEALESYRRSIELNAAHGFTDREALARASAAVSYVALGDGVASAAELRSARALASVACRPVVDMLSGLVLQRTGRLAEALDVYREALRGLERSDDQPAIARLRLNRGILNAYRGNLEPALDDLAEAERIALARDLPVLAAMAAHNTGFARGRQGRLPEALAALDRAAAQYAVLDSAERLVAVLSADRCEVLLLAGLVPEAVAASRAAVVALEGLGDAAHLAECRLLHARTLLAARAYDEAVAEAELAAHALARAGRLAWAAQARYVGIQAATLALQDDAAPPPGLLPRARRIATELDRRGWPVEALHVRSFVGRLALALGRPDLASAELSAAAAARRKGTADLRAQAWHATALVRLAAGNRAGAKRALTRGMAVVDEHRATLGATELRALAAAHSVELAQLGIRLAMDDGRPAEVLRWVERSRAASLRRPAVRPPDDAGLAADLAELRVVRASLRDTTLDGSFDAAARHRVVDLEHRVRARTLVSGDHAPATGGRLDVRRLRSALGDAVLVEYLSVRGRTHAVTVSSSGTRLHDLGPTADIVVEKDYLRFALRRSLSSHSGARGTLTATAARLDGLLVQPLGLRAGGPCVVVPSAELHGLTWACLPGLRGRATTITPSAAVWLGDRRPERSPAGGVALVAGPLLPGAAAEVAALCDVYPGAEVVTGERATAPDVLAAVERADLAHVAAHGTFRSDSPMFSSLALADGPLTVYDLESLHTVPRIVVLSVCDAALATVHAGDELLGTASALLGLGVRSVIAPVLPVPDEATVDAMVSFHRHLAEGCGPAHALARTIEGHDAAAAFVCIGRDDATFSE